MKFELIDQVMEQTADRIVAIKNVTMAEEYLADHFPGFAVLPGVMMLETLVQAGRRLVDPDDAAGPLVLSRVRNLKYGNMVRPGQSLRVEVTLRQKTADEFDLVGVGKVGDDVAVQGRFTLSPIPRA